MDYIAYLHKEHKSDFGVSFPDFPGCIAAGKTLEEARIRAAESLAMHIAGLVDDGDPLPKPSTIDLLSRDPALKGAIAFLVHVEPERDKPARINITVREKQVKEIDRLANSVGLSRSAYMVQAALNRLPRETRSKHRI